MTDTLLERQAANLVVQADPRKWSNYATSSELPRGVNWGMLITRSNASDTLAESNWECVVRDLEKTFGSEDEENGWVIERDRHWAVGWVEVLYIKYFENNTEDTELTEIGYWAMENVYLALQDYPIYDEDHFSNKEYEYASQHLTSEIDAEYLPIVEKYIWEKGLSPDYGDSWSGKQIEHFEEYVEELRNSVEKARDFLDYLDTLREDSDE